MKIKFVILLTLTVGWLGSGITSSLGQTVSQPIEARSAANAMGAESKNNGCENSSCRLESRHEATLYGHKRSPQHKKTPKKGKKRKPHSRLGLPPL
jgi:hypothetical protein